MGQEVRYDGLSRFHQPIMDYLSSHLELIPFCPEVGSGLAVPREKIHLCVHQSQTGLKQIRVKQINDQSIDYTDKLSLYSREFMKQVPDLSAIILKSRSPSCGLFSTPIIEQGQEIRKGSGQFTYIIKTEYKPILLIEETKLENIRQCNEFLSSITAKPEL